MKTIVVSVLLLCIFSQSAKGQKTTDSTFQFTRAVIALVNPVPANYYSKHTGFFCRYEIMMDKQVKLPVRFRLGSAEYCNFLEQKPAYRYLKY